MANYFSNLFTNVMDAFAYRVASYIQDPMSTRYKILGDYYQGDHRPQLKRTEGKQDDNIYRNFVGLAVDRSVSRLFQGGVRWELPKGSEKQQEYLDKVWDLNKKEIILYQVGLYGANMGTCYFKTSPDGVIDPYTGEYYPRLIPIYPPSIRVRTAPQDKNDVEEYRIEYTIPEERGGRTVTVLHREITKHATIETYDENGYTTKARVETWVIESYEQVGGGAMQMVGDPILWIYDFPPIIHWKNLPSLDNCYGDSEIDDVINIQDKQNFITSNTGKIIKFHAHPETVGTGFSAGELESVPTGPGLFRVIPNPNAKVFNLEMQSDLASSRAFAEDLRQSIFDIAREPDISSMRDNVGALTNFGLRVLFTDAIQKNDTKRQLYGDAFKELNRRLLVLNGWTGEASNPGDVVWGEAMPINVLEEMQADKMALDMKIVDIETVARKYQVRYGVDWETLKANLQKQQSDEPPQEDAPSDAVDVTDELRKVKA